MIYWIVIINEHPISYMKLINHFCFNMNTNMYVLFMQFISYNFTYKLIISVAHTFCVRFSMIFLLQPHIVVTFMISFSTSDEKAVSQFMVDIVLLQLNFIVVLQLKSLHLSALVKFILFYLFTDGGWEWQYRSVMACGTNFKLCKLK